MSVTIKCNLFLIDDESEKESIEFLKKIRIASQKLQRNYDIGTNYNYYVELKDNISILDVLKESGYFDKGRNEIMNIMNISEIGITLYLADEYFGDGSIFIPMNNVIGIHTINRKNIEWFIKKELK